MAETVAPKSKILIVEERPNEAKAVEETLRAAGYANIHIIRKAGEISDRQKELKPDIIIVSPLVSDTDPVEVLEQMKKDLPPDSYLPVVALMSQDVSEEQRQRMLATAARDFIRDPIDKTEVSTRVASYLEARSLYVKMQKKQHMLQEQLSSRNRELESAQFELLERLAMVVEHRDDDTGQHVQRVAKMSRLLAEDLGLPEIEVELITRAAPLHDVGKIAIPDSILKKPGKMTPEEFSTMQSHTTVGARLLSGGRSMLMLLAEQIALAHHERWDGKGYPLSVKEWAIPMSARLMSMADVFDALTHARPYKPAWPLEDVLAEFAKLKGKQFDPTVVDALMRVLEREDLEEFTE